MLSYTILYYTSRISLRPPLPSRRCLNSKTSNRIYIGICIISMINIVVIGIMIIVIMILIISLNSKTPNQTEMHCTSGTLCFIIVIWCSSFVVVKNELIFFTCNTYVYIYIYIYVYM